MAKSSKRELEDAGLHLADRELVAELALLCALAEEAPRLEASHKSFFHQLRAHLEAFAAATSPPGARDGE